MDLRTPPEFKSTKMPWKFGLIRDIIWSDSLQRFVLLTKNMIYTFDPNAFSQQVFSKAPTNDVTIETYAQIQPVHSSYAFWRCATFDDTLLIIYAGLSIDLNDLFHRRLDASLGFGTVMDQYKITRKSSQLIKRWQPPATCAPYEGIWCIRHHPETKQIGCALLDARTNHWRLEVRDRERFTCLWRINLPFENGDCEVSPLLNGQWLTTNSFNVRLIQVAQERLESAVEYERELKNALLLNDDFLVLRTKSTIEIHRLDQMK